MDDRDARAGGRRAPVAKGERVIQAGISTYPTQALTVAIPLGFFILVLFVGFFQRRSSR